MTLTGEAARLRFDLMIAAANVALCLPGHRFRVAVLRHLVRADVGGEIAIERRVRISARGRLVVGRGSNINRGTYLDARGGLTIGEHVNISPEVSLLTGDHDPATPEFVGRERPVVIGDRVWIASNAIILPGTTIGEGAVVAAGAVVRGDVAPWSIVAGNPAAPIGERPRDAQAGLAPYRRWFQ